MCDVESVWQDMRVFPSDPAEFKTFYIQRLKQYMNDAEQLRLADRTSDFVDLIEMTYRFILHHFDRSRFLFNSNLISAMMTASVCNRDQTRTSHLIAPGRRTAMYALFDELRKRCEQIVV